MKAIILAAGRGVRLRPYTHITPKPLLKINGKRIIDYTLDILPQEIDEVIIVIGHLKWRMKWHLGEKHKHRKITYIVQKDKKGTAHALYLCKPFLKKKERFLVLFGDNIYAKKDLEKCLSYKLSILAKEIENPKNFGVLTFDENRHLKEIIEKPNDSPTNLVNCGVFVLNRKIFNYHMEAINKKEFGLPQTIVKMAQDYPIKIIKASFWVPVGYPSDLKNAKAQLKNIDIV